ncbi:pantetheine-phosphate adenylyltransferase [candidate division WOR-3 bacterium]|nr:pantetheine-phosphate adenylyltransferase [candidate division WOR-3 bacterium]
MRKNKNSAIYPGSFDPVTNGHLDIVRRASGIFQNLIILVADNPSKKYVFNAEDRKDFIIKAIGETKEISVEIHKGLLAEYIQKSNVNIVIRGLRFVSDFEYELSLALMNRKLNSSIETIFLAPREELIYLSSTMVKEIASFGGDVSQWVPNCVQGALESKYKLKKK